MIFSLYTLPQTPRLHRLRLLKPQRHLLQIPRPQRARAAVHVIPDPHAMAIGQLPARIPGMPEPAGAEAEGLDGGEEGGQERVLRPGAPDRLQACEAFVGDPEEDRVGGRRPGGLVPAGAPVAGALRQLAGILAAAVDLEHQAHNADARRRCVVRAEILRGVGVCSRPARRQPVEIVANRGEPIAAGIAAAEGPDRPAHAADAQVALDVLVQRDAEAVGQQQPWSHPLGDRAHRRDAREARLAQEAGAAPAQLVAAPARDGDRLDVLLRLPAAEALRAGLPAHRLRPDERAEIVLVEQDAVVQPLEHQPGTLAELLPGDAPARSGGGGHSRSSGMFCPNIRWVTVLAMSP